MSELDDGLRAAVTRAAHATAAPPFARVERRARARRNRQVAGVAAAVVAVLGAGSLALPGGPTRSTPLPPTGSTTPTGTVAPAGPKPYEDIQHDPTARRLVASCLAEHASASPATFPDKMRVRRHQEVCYAEAGYQPPPMSVAITGTASVVVPPGPDDGYCRDTPVPGADVRTLASESAAGRTVYVVAWEGPEAHLCAGFGGEPRLEPPGLDRDNDTGTRAHPVETLAFDFLTDDAGDWYVFWGAVRTAVARVEVTLDDGVRKSFATTVADRRAYVGIVLHLPRGSASGGKSPVVKGYDANGREVPLPDLNS